MSPHLSTASIRRKAVEMRNPPFTHCRHTGYIDAWERCWDEETPDGILARSVLVAKCRDCGVVTEEFNDSRPVFPLPPRQFAVLSSDPCPRCGGSGTLTDYDGQDRAYQVRCDACRGTGGVLVDLETALKVLEAR